MKLFRTISILVSSPIIGMGLATLLANPKMIGQLPLKLSLRNRHAKPTDAKVQATSDGTTNDGSRSGEYLFAGKSSQSQFSNGDTNFSNREAKEADQAIEPDHYFTIHCNVGFSGYHFRTIGSLNGKIITVIPCGAKVIDLGFTTNGWSLVDYQGKSGYVISSVLMR